MAAIGILGAGLTGLTLGSLLEEAEIIEKEKTCGGLCRTIKEKGFYFDCCGSHIIFSKDKKILRFMIEKLSGNVTRCRRNTKIFYKGHYVKYPFENNLSDLPLLENISCLLGLAKAKVKRNKNPKNFRDWIYQTFGNGIAERYLIPYNEKIWKYDLAEMDIPWAEDRVPNPPFADVLKSSIGFRTEGYKHQLNFYYPKKGGIQALIESLEKKCKDRVIKNFEVKKIYKKNDKWCVSNGNEERYYERIISTIPIFSTVGSMKNVPFKVREALSKLKYNSLITIMLGFDGNLNDFSWLYIPDQKLLPHRIAFPSNYSKYVCPKGKSSAIVEITYREGDFIDRMSDEKIINMVINGLHRNKIIDKRKIIFSKLKRTKFAYVIQDKEYKKNISLVRKFVESSGISLLGRFAEFEYLNMDACVKRAIELGEKIKNE